MRPTAAVMSRPGRGRLEDELLASGDAVVMLSPCDDAILDANPTACNLLGYGKSELLRRRVSDIHPEDMPLLMKLADIAMGWGEGWTDALSCVTKSGRIVPAEVSAVGLRTVEGDRLIAVVRRASTRGDWSSGGHVLCGQVHRAPDLLRIPHSKSTAVQPGCALDLLAEGVLMLGADARILYANRQAGRAMGRSPEELGGVDARTLLPSSCQPSGSGRVDPLAAALATGTVAPPHRRLLHRGDGLHLTADVGCTPIFQDGRLHGWVILLRGPGASSLTCMGIAPDRDWARSLSLHTEAIDQTAPCSGMVGNSPGIRRVLRQIYTVAPTDAPVLVTGETGTGKELVARAIHEHSSRAACRFVRVNCAAVPRELFESEFFGHVRGAFTGAVADRAGRFESADGGTLLLDEIGELPIELQGKLLTVLQAGEFERLGEGRVRHANVRLIAATNRSLAHELAAGRFRSDLYYRLSVFPIAVPPLRDRREDIPLLVDHILAGCARKLGCTIPAFPAAEVLRLVEYPWPGNVRELENVLERASIDARSGEALRVELSGPVPAVAPTVELGTPPAILTETERRDRYRREVVSALEHAQGRIAGPRGAAALLGLKPTTLRSRIQALGMELASVARLRAAGESHGRDVTVTRSTAGGV